jgi:hypothetical protein
MGSRDHGMVEFGVQIPMAPFDASAVLAGGFSYDKELLSPREVLR